MSELRNLSFTVEEYRSRVKKVQREMAKVGMDALLSHNFPSICYLTGFQSIMGTAKYFMAVVPKEGDPWLLGQSFEMPNALIHCWLEDKIGYELFIDPIEASRKLLVERGLADKRLGLEMNTLCLSAASCERLKQALPRATFLDASNVVASVRAVKSSTEIDYLRQASRITSGAMGKALEEAKIGKTDNDIAAAAMDYCVRHGGEFFCLEPIVSLGGRSGVPHCTFGRNKIKPGDLCFIEIGACIHRYSGALIRTFSIGKPGPIQQRVCDEIEASLNAVIANLKPGIPAREVALKARKPWEWTYTNQELFWNGAYGYSTGLGFPPDWGDADLNIREEDLTILQPGMVFHCTNNIRKGGVFGMGISETVAITETGCEVLTDFPRHLFVL